MFKRRIYEDWLSATNTKNSDGFYKCRKEECSRTFRFDRKLRIFEHEKSNGLHKDLAPVNSDEESDLESDLMTCYQISVHCLMWVWFCFFFF